MTFILNCIIVAERVVHVCKLQYDNLYVLKSSNIGAVQPLFLGRRGAARGGHHYICKGRRIIIYARGGASLYMQGAAHHYICKGRRIIIYARGGASLYMQIIKGRTSEGA